MSDVAAYGHATVVFDRRTARLGPVLLALVTNLSVRRKPWGPRTGAHPCRFVARFHERPQAKAATVPERRPHTAGDEDHAFVPEARLKGRNK
jgi:hypothetical protein